MTSNRLDATFAALSDPTRRAILASLALLAGAFVLLLGITGLTGRGHGSVGKVSRRLRKIISR